jgi:hypothetical protein
MTKTIQMACFPYKELENLNAFIKTVDLASQPFVFKEDGIYVIFTEKREGHGLTREEHIQSVQDELGKCEAELADSLLSYSETKLGFDMFNGKSGMKKIANSYLQQKAMDADTVELRRAKVIALRSLLNAIETNSIKLGSEAVKDFMENGIQEDEKIASPFVPGEDEGNQDVQEEGPVKKID